MWRTLSIHQAKVRMPKTFIITGGNAGLGFQCASTLNADRGNVIVLACRDVTAEIFLGWL